MTTSLSNELQDFHRFVTEKLANGEAQLSPEEVVDEWRALHPTPDELAENVAAVKEALADMAAGEKGRPVDDVLAEIRDKLRQTATG